MKLVDLLDSKSCGGNPVPVRFRPEPPFISSLTKGPIMKISQILKLALIGLALAVSSCSDSSSPGNGKPTASPASTLVVNANPGAGTIAILGDSLAAGSGATNLKVTPEGCLSGLPNAGQVNYSVPGRTSYQILSSVNQIYASKPKLIFVSSGGNDAIMDMMHPGSYSAAKTYDEMEIMFDRLVATRALVVYLGLNPGLAGAERLPQISDMASRKGILVVDGMQGFWGDPNLMADSYHPNNVGYKIMCDRILAAIAWYYP